MSLDTSPLPRRTLCPYRDGSVDRPVLMLETAFCDLLHLPRHLGQKVRQSRSALTTLRRIRSKVAPIERSCIVYTVSSILYLLSFDTFISYLA